MTVGLQIWNKEQDGNLAINITDRCTSIVGTLDVGFWAGKSYDKDDVFNWRSIIVPEFSLGQPFWAFKNNAKNKIHQLVDDGLLDDKWLYSYYWGFSCISIEPEVYVEGDYLYYRYPPDAKWVPGDYASWYVGGHIMFYGVC